MILHGIEYQRPTSLNMRILADHVTYSFLAFTKSIFHFCLGCYCGGYSQNGRSNLSSLPWSIDYLIRFWSWPWPWIFKIKCRIYYISAKNGVITTKQKANISIELWTSNLTIEFDLGHDLDLEFSRSNTEFAISQPKMVLLPGNRKQTYRLNSRPQMWPSGLTLAMTLNLIFQGQICNLLYLSPKWSVKASNVTIRFDFGHELDLEFSRSNMWFAISQPKKVRLPRNGKQTYRMNSRPQMWPMGLTLAMTLIFEFSRSNVT